MDLETIIRRLIISKREGDYWDFKEEPHENKANLLHDIICMANSLHKGDRYIILGVTDPKQGATIKGLIPNQDNRRTQVQYIDFLRSKQFAGNCRPEIELQTLLLNGVEFDVLIILDKPSKPYYLTEDYKEKGTIVKSNNIYTRTNDTNTPIDKSADIDKIEKMWKQRFGLDFTPLERLEILLLKPNEWFKDIGNKPYAYHKEFPEFRIEFSEVEEFREVYSFFFPNDCSFYGNATFKFHSTTLFEYEFMYCDEMRIEFPVPKIEYLRVNNEDNWYFYFDLSELNGKFLYFLTNGLTNLSSRGSIFPFLIFENQKHRVEFNEYVKDNIDFIKNNVISFHGADIKKRMTEMKLSTTIDPEFIDRIIQIRQMGYA
jgi:hypothetical protein